MPPAAGPGVSMTQPERVANTPEMVARFVAIFQRNPAPELIGNLVTEVGQITVAGRVYPITLNGRGEEGNCYICNPVTGYIDYAIDETRNFAAHPALRRMVRGLIRGLSPLVRASGLDHQVQINNWLFSTNPVPRLDRSAAAEMRAQLVRDYPDRALVLRSLNELADCASLEALQAEGFVLLPARQVYIFSGESEEGRVSPNRRRDLQALARTALTLVENEDFCEADYEGCARLYAQLYLEKYTALNPQYTGLFIAEMHRAGLLRLRGLRNPEDGRLLAVTGMFENGRTLTQPIVGYDTARPMGEGLYRMVMAMAQEHAQDEGLFFNMSAGAAAFKRHRQARPVIEYTAVFVEHLPRVQRFAVAMMALVLRRVGVPLLRRFEL
jgi:hypothetical protein